MASEPLLSPASPTSLTPNAVRDRRMEFQEVLDQEADEIRRVRQKRLELQPEEAEGRFSVAFGGGGVRAAAFEAGVLWRLAETGHLRQVRYLSANSGGSFAAAALASHLCEAGQPDNASSTGDLYLRAVADMIVRMLRNAPFVARPVTGIDSLCTHPTDGSSYLPRIFDVPIFIAVLAFTLVFRPIVMGTIIACPLLEAFNWCFGAAMRSAFCAPGRAGMLIVFLERSHFEAWGKLLVVLVVTTFVLFAAGRCGAWRRKRLGDGVWLWVRSSVAALNRITAFLLLVLSMVIVVVVLQQLLYPVAQRQGICARYLAKDPASSLVDGPSSWSYMTCADVLEGSPWYQHVSIQSSSPSTAEHETSTKEHIPWSTMIPEAERLRQYELHLLLLGLLLLVTFAFVLLPLVPELLSNTLAVLGPAVLFGLTCLLLQWRIYSPVVGEPVTRLLAGHEVLRTSVVMRAAMLTAMATMPFYSWLASSFHLYYRRSIQKVFIAAGKDIDWGSLRENAYCPYLLFNGTVTDYMRPGDVSPVSEVFFSMLHLGGERTAYLAMRPRESVAKFMAISAAATDAFILGMNDLKRNRYWLCMLGLGMGRDLLFDLDQERARTAIWLARWWSDKDRAGREWFLRKLLRAHRRLPALILSELIFGFILLSHDRPQDASGEHCAQVAMFCTIAGMLSVLMFVFSFFGFLPYMGWLVEWPILQHLHQITRFYHCAENPPQMLYVGDGGAVDSSGVLQLLRRRCSRILFVLNEDDPHDRLPGLRKLIIAAIEEKLAAFYDPVDPRRDWKEVLQAFAEDKCMSFLHLGIRFGWEGDELGQGDEGWPRQSGAMKPRQNGHLVVIKNRIPENSPFEKALVQPLLTKEEILGNKDLGKCRASGIRKADLGGFVCCCDACHGCQSLNDCGHRFPNAPIINQLLTPQYMSELCRLGHAISADAVEFITRSEPLEHNWELHVEEPGSLGLQLSVQSFRSCSSDASDSWVA